MSAVSTEQPDQEAETAEVSKLPPLDITRAETWPEMLTVEELSAILRSSTKSIRDMIASGEIKALRGAGRGFRISKRWVIANILHDPS